MTREQAALLKKARASLRGAKLLAEDGLYDFAASRAYYTMFYLAEALLLGQGLSFSKHTAVIAAFGRRFARPGMVPAEFHRYLIGGNREKRQPMPQREALGMTGLTRLMRHLGQLTCRP